MNKEFFYLLMYHYPHPSLAMREICVLLNSLSTGICYQGNRDLYKSRVGNPLPTLKSRRSDGIRSACGHLSLSDAGFIRCQGEVAIALDLL